MASSRLDNIDVIVNESCKPSRFFIRTEAQANQFFSFHQEMQKFYRGWLSSDVESLREGDAEEEPEDNLLYFSNSLLVVLHQVPTYYHYTTL